MGFKRQDFFQAPEEAQEPVKVDLTSNDTTGPQSPAAGKPKVQKK
jgi:hypothetical protein